MFFCAGFFHCFLIVSQTDHGCRKQCSDLNAGIAGLSDHARIEKALDLLQKREKTKNSKNESNNDLKSDQTSTCKNDDIVAKILKGEQIQVFTDLGRDHRTVTIVHTNQLMQTDHWTPMKTSSCSSDLEYNSTTGKWTNGYESIDHASLTFISTSYNPVIRRASNLQCKRNFQASSRIIVEVTIVELFASKAICFVFNHN